VPSDLETFSDIAIDPPVRGFLHRASPASQDGLVLTHGAGGNCQAALLVALARAFADTGITVLRCDLPYRQVRPYGPPRPGEASRDRQGLRNAVAALRSLVAGRVFLGGHSYGGRQATMLAADEPELVSGLLLSSYPLHPPGKPAQLRIQHFPRLQAAALFVQGTRDPFGSIEEMEPALRLIPGRTMLLKVEGVGHDLGFKGKSTLESVPANVRTAFQSFFT